MILTRHVDHVVPHLESIVKFRVLVTTSTVVPPELGSSQGSEPFYVLVLLFLLNKIQEINTFTTGFLVSGEHRGLLTSFIRPLTQGSGLSPFLTFNVKILGPMYMIITTVLKKLGLCLVTKL